MRTAALRLLMLAAAVGTSGAALAQSAHKLPYFASISASQARMRTGPGRTYPASWLYQRAGLPVRVVESYQTWRKVEDPDGTQGWMLANLLTSKRTGMVRGGTAELRDAPSPTARVLWRAEPGVIGKVSRCANGWCWLDVKGQAGFVETGRLWGVDPDESLG